MDGTSKTCPNCGHEHDSKVAKCEKCGGDMSKKKVKEDAELQEGDNLQEGDTLTPIIESSTALIVPKKGPLFEHLGGDEYRGKFALIRPCQSRGRAIRGYQPIYEPSMLAEHAAVFADWPMYGDHLNEALAEEFMEKLSELGRSIKELGGRVASSWYDPDLVMEGDEEKGYRKGGVVGWVHPQPWTREMLNADRHILETSINAWPTGVKVGRPSWDTSKKGAVVEGIRRKPMGSVDFVFRGGAGGRPMAVSEEDRTLAVTILESAYSSPRDGNPDPEPTVKKLSEMSHEEIRKLPKDKLVKLLKEEGSEAVAESIAEAIALGADGGSGGSGGGGAPEGTPLTAESLAEALETQKRELTEEFETKMKEAKESGDTELRERDKARPLEVKALEILAEAKDNGFPQAWVDQLKPRYQVLTEGIGSGLKLSESDLEGDEGKTLSQEEAIVERVTADINEAIKLIEAGGGKPRVKGFGATAADEQGSEGKDKGGSGGGNGGGKGRDLVAEASGNRFLGFLVESGDLTGDPEKDNKRLSEMVRG